MDQRVPLRFQICVPTTTSGQGWVFLGGKNNSTKDQGPMELLQSYVVREATYDDLCQEPGKI